MSAYKTMFLKRTNPVLIFMQLQVFTLSYFIKKAKVYQKLYFHDLRYGVPYIYTIQQALKLFIQGVSIRFYTLSVIPSWYGIHFVFLQLNFYRATLNSHYGRKISSVVLRLRSQHKYCNPDRQRRPISLKGQAGPHEEEDHK